MLAAAPAAALILWALLAAGPSAGPPASPAPPAETPPAPPGAGSVPASRSREAEVPTEAVRGFVRSAADGAPVAGARVKGYRGPVLVRHMRVGGPSGPPVGSVETGSDGGFDLPSETGFVLVRAEGFATARVWLDPNRREVRLDPGGAVVGRVTGPDGEPLAGADVFVCLEGSSTAAQSSPTDWRVENGCDPGSAFTSAETARTGADGRYRVEGVPVDRSLFVWARAPGLVPSAARWGMRSRLDRPAIVDLRCGPAATLEVRAVREDGSPFGGARVQLWNGPRPPRAVRADDAGRIRWDDAVPGPARLRFDEPGFEAEDVEAVLAAGETRVVRVTFVATRVTVAGRVVDFRGRPIAGAEVTVDRRQREADAEGRFRFEDVPRSDWSVEAQEPGYAPAAVRGSDARKDLVVALAAIVPVSIPFELPAGAVPDAGNAEVSFSAGGERQRRTYPPSFLAGGEIDLTVPEDVGTLRLRVPGFLPVELPLPEGLGGKTWCFEPVALSRGTELALRIETPDGRPLAGAEVGYRQEATGTFGFAKADAAGRLVAGGFVPDGDVVLRVWAPGFGEEVATVRPAGRDRPVTVPVPRFGTLAVSLREADGPVSDSKVGVRRLLPDGGEEGAASGFTDAAGRLEIDLGPGRYRVSAGGRPAVEVEVRSGERRDLEIRVPPSPGDR